MPVRGVVGPTRKAPQLEVTSGSLCRNSLFQKCKNAKNSLLQKRIFVSLHIGQKEELIEAIKYNFREPDLNASAPRQKQKFTVKYSENSQ